MPWKRLLGLAFFGVWLSFFAVQNWGDGLETLSVSTWNIGAVNMNPFEYWVQHDDPSYMVFMSAVQERFDDPGDADVPAGAVFTQEMFDELEKRMSAEGWEGVAEVRDMWLSDLSRRNMISELLKDKTLGDKRLMSMPDRMTNTLVASEGGGAFRPTPISSYRGKMSELPGWWSQWLDFMFSQRVRVGERTLRVAELLAKIPRKKYPALSEEEERISVPLQVLCLALFDATLVHTVTDVAARKEIDWESLRAGLLTALVSEKPRRAVEILAARSSDDVVFLQEVAGTFPADCEANPTLAERFHVLKTHPFDPQRNQHSIILLSKSTFPLPYTNDLSQDCARRARELGSEVADGDLFCALVADKRGSRRHLLASFHGDTNGLMTKAVTEAIFDTWRKVGGGNEGVSATLIAGMDANTHHVHNKKKQGVFDFYEAMTAMSVKDGQHLLLRSVYDGLSLNTTYNMRTALQPQLQKAVRLAEMEASPLVDRNPKDHIIYVPEEWAPVEGTLRRDNTGMNTFTEGIMPSLIWPSDHALTSVTLARTSKNHGK